MKIARKDLDDAVVAGILAEPQGKALWDFLVGKEHETPTFKAAHILYYLGGLIAIGAMTLFMNIGWEQFGASGLLFISFCYAVLAIGLTEYFLGKRHLSIPAGITATLAICMTPLIIYAAQKALGFWPDDDRYAYRDFHVYIDWRWIVMELGTLAAAAFALWRYRLPFMVMPVAVILWYMSMDLVPLLLGGHASEFFSNEGKRISLTFGLLMLLLAFFVDIRSVNSDRKHPGDFAFWLYLFGVLTFWGALSSFNSGSAFNKFLYCCINLILIAVGAALSRRVFAVFGGLGVAGYLGYLSYSVFKDSLLFPVALTAIGFAVIGAGIYWQRHEEEIGRALRSILPSDLARLIAHRDSR